MKLGFVGTGVITEAIVTGLLEGDSPVSEVVVSARNAETASRLATRYARVRVARDNQEVVDAAEVVFLAVRPQIAHAVVAPLRMREGQRVVSLIAMLALERLREWVGPSAALARAIPLPSVATRNGVTAIYPPSPELRDLFSLLGGVVETDTVDAFDAYAVASALMGTFFGLMEETGRWMEGKGTGRAEAKAYLARLFLGLALTATQGGDLARLRAEHSTPGGLNEQCYAIFAARGGWAALADALDGVAARISGAFASDLPD